MGNINEIKKALKSRYLVSAMDKLGYNYYELFDRNQMFFENKTELIIYYPNDGVFECFMKTRTVELNSPKETNG